MARKIFSQLAQEPGSVTPTKLAQDKGLRENYYNLLTKGSDQPLSNLYQNPSSRNTLTSEPYISKEIDDDYGNPITGIVQVTKVADDVSRLAQFLTSGRGLTWLGKQVILQNSNTRVETTPSIFGRVDTFSSNVITSPIYNAAPLTVRPTRVGEGFVSRLADFALGAVSDAATDGTSNSLLMKMFKEARGEVNSVDSFVSTLGNIINTAVSVFSGQTLPKGQPWATLAYMDTKLAGVSTGLNIPRRSVNTFKPTPHNVPTSTPQFSYNQIFSDRNKSEFATGRTGIQKKWAPAAKSRLLDMKEYFRSVLTSESGSGDLDKYIKLEFGYADDNQHFSPEKYVKFRGNVIAFSDNINATWDASEYIGVPVELYWYQKTVRDVQFGFYVYVHNHEEFGEVWNRIQELKSLMYPSYTDQKRPAATFVWLTLGDLFVKMPMIIRDMTTTIDETYMWEVEDGFQAPHGIEIQIGGVVLYDNIPTRGEGAGTIYNIKTTDLSYLPAIIDPTLPQFTPTPVADDELEAQTGELNETI